jgi:hypothetical protein
MKAYLLMSGHSPPSVLKFIAKHYPGRDPKDVFAKELATEVYGPRPVWSTRDDYQISASTRMNVGNFLIPFHVAHAARNRDRGRHDEVFIVFQKRADKGPRNEDRYGALGGYINADYVAHGGKVIDRSRGEQPEEGALREMNEELVDDQGEPILDIAAARIAHVHASCDYRIRPGTVVQGFEVRLTNREFAAVKAHSGRMANDPGYAMAVRQASHGEVNEILVRPLRDVVAMRRNHFTHPHEYDALKKLARRLLDRSRNMNKGRKR